MKKLISAMLSVACIMQSCLCLTVGAENDDNWAQNIALNSETNIYERDEADSSFYDEPVTRAEFVTLTSRFLGFNEAVEYDGFFKDMDGAEWYAPYVQFAQNSGFLHEGITREKRFKADTVVTNEEMAIILTLATNPDWDKVITTTLYEDYSDISDWALRCMSQAIRVGYIKGTDDLHLNPQKQVTRGEALDMLRYAADLISQKPVKSGDAVIGDSEYGAFTAENYIVNDFTDLSKWKYEVRTKDAVGTVSHLAGEGSSPDDGCIFYDLETAGVRDVNALQIKYELHKENAIEAGKKYRCGFKAKLTDSDPDKDITLKVGRANLRDIEQGAVVWSDGNRVFQILESDEWINYEIEFTAVENHNDVVLMYMLGGDGNTNIKIYLDDFYWIPEKEEEISTKIELDEDISDEINSADVRLSVDEDNNETEYPILSAAAVKESGLLLNYWKDPYGNKVSPNSVYVAPVQDSYTYKANFAHYDYKDRGFEAPVSEVVSVTAETPTIKGISASANGKVALPEGYKLLDAGMLFYDGYWTENFNLFSENIENIPASTVSENGEFSAETVMNTRYGVLARAYAIVENPKGLVMVQYSDTEYTHSPNRPEKIEHKGIVYYELWQSFKSSSVTNRREYGMTRMEEVALTGADIITLTPSEHKFNMWNSKVDPFWADAKYEGMQNHDVKNNTKDYIFNGGDPVQDAVDGAKRSNMYLFIDQRMNDHHYSANSTWTTHSPFWKSHPNFWLKEVEEVTTTGATDGNITWRVFNYLIPEVREYFYSLIEELLTLYDVDGVQMDFDRHDLYFLENEVEMGSEVLTEFVGRVREMVNRASIDRGKDIQLSVRLDESVEHAYKTGWDVAEWCRRDYVDILNVGDTYFNHLAVDIEGFKKIAKNAKVFGEMHYNTLERGPAKERRIITEQLCYATAKSFYDRGADGISLFNFQFIEESTKDFKELYKKIRPCFDKNALDTLEKNYVFTIHEGPWGFGTRTKLDFNFNIYENPDNFSSIIARIEHGDNISTRETRFVLNGVELKEISRTDAELFPTYSQGALAYPERCKFFEVPLDVFKNGENHFMIETDINVIIQCMHLAFYN